MHMIIKYKIHIYIFPPKITIIFSRVGKKTFPKQTNSEKFPSLFSDKCDIFVQNKKTKKLKGCGFLCGDREHEIKCPTCKKFVFHEDCLNSLFEENNLELPAFYLNSSAQKYPLIEKCVSYFLTTSCVLKHS